MQKNRHAFTLIELLVVISIVVILIAILMPALSKARDAGRKTKCLSNERQLLLANTAFINDNNGHAIGAGGTGPHGAGQFVDVRTPDKVYSRKSGLFELGYVNSFGVFVCPGMHDLVKKLPAPSWDALHHYTYNIWVIGDNYDPKDRTCRRWGKKMKPKTLAKKPSETSFFWDMAWSYDRGDPGPNNIVPGYYRSIQQGTGWGHFGHGKNDMGNIGFLDGHAKSFTPVLIGNMFYVGSSSSGI